MKPIASKSPFAPFALAFKERRLIANLAWRRIESRYRGSVLGLLWAVIDPLLMLSVYTFVFSIVFKAKWGSGAAPENNLEFALFLFSGLTIYGLFSQTVNEAPTTILSQKTLVTDIVFPLEILSCVSLAVSLFNFAVSFLILIAFYLLVNGLPPPTILWIPILIVPMSVGTLGISWFISSLGVYIRDVAQITSVITTVLLFLSPVFYPIDRVPEAFADVYRMNPLASLLDMTKGAMFRGEHPDPLQLITLLLGSWAIAWLGYLWFMTTKRGFSDVL